MLHTCYTPLVCFFSFFFNDTATTEIYTLSLHDALPICLPASDARARRCARDPARAPRERSEEHTSELQSRPHLVCRLLLEKKTSKIARAFWQVRRQTLRTLPRHR